MLLRPGRFLHLALALAVIVPMGLAHAQDDDSDHPVKKKTKKAINDAEKVAAGGQGYGIAGCGLGSLVFGATPGYIQIVSVTLNATSGNQTFAITTGTLNCDIPQMGFQAANFIERNHESVSTELARGQGETVASLAYLLKCSDAELFGAKMRENYGNILESGISTLETTRRMLKTIDTNPDLKMTCQSQKLG